ncbi:MAG: hypothetical protein M3R07_08045, partial [Gemmatimonadota bacterium]|nr:hypothetical protein [Gemmatimonadota bacterium]
YTGGPYPITNRPLADPPTVIYIAADYETYERPYTLAMVGEQVNAELGDRRQVEARTVWLPVVQEAATDAFSFDGGSLSSRKSWKGLIFRSGNYPDKCGEVSPENLRAIVASFPSGGVPVLSEHDDSLIGLAMHADGTRLTRVWTANGDTELHGEIETPGWLDYALRDIKKSVSIGLGYTKDFLREISLVLNPRISDAAVFAGRAAIAFSATPAFQTLRSAHPGPAQQIVTLATAPDPAPARSTGQGNLPMNFRAKLSKAWSFLTPEQRAEIGLTEAEINDPANFATAPEIEIDPATKARIARLESDNAASKKIAATQAAHTFYADMLQAAKVVPAQKDALIALYTNLVPEGPSFSDTGESVVSTGEQALRDLLKAFPAKFSTSHVIPVAPEDAANPYALTPEAARKALGVGKN